MNNPVNMEIDHKDENKLNNQRYNLRLATHSQNMINKKIRKDNTSGYKGVHITSGKYILAHIRTGGKQIHLGSFIDIVSAAHAYDDAAKKYYGEFARLNFPE